MELDVDTELRELLLADRVKVVWLNSERAGEAEGEGESEPLGDCAGGKLGICTSLRTTMRDRCRRFLANLLETYSRASVTCVGSCFESRSDFPASMGGEI